jgi:hypothetical protein
MSDDFTRLIARAACGKRQKRRRRGLVPRHDIEGLPQDPIQEPDWPPGRRGAELCQWVYDARPGQLWSYLRLPPETRPEIPQGSPSLAFNLFAEAIYDPADAYADEDGYRRADWWRDYYPTADGQCLQHGVEFRSGQFIAHGRPAPVDE